MGEPDGLCKLITDENGKIIGAHIFGAHAADLVQEVSALMNRETTVSQLKEMIHAHPTPFGNSARVCPGILNTIYHKERLPVTQEAFLYI